DLTDTSFNFTAEGGLSPSSFSLKDGESQDFYDVPVGTYNITETVPGGWTLTSVNCTGGTCTNITNGVSINLGAAENVTCTFTNTKKGSITIKKETDPDGSPQSFNFTGSGGLGGFNLSDGGSKPFSDLLPGSYNITETVPGGWTLTSVNCTGGTCTDITNGVSINLGAGENVTCTFNNTQLGSITIEKQTNPDGSTQSFNFTGTPGSFNLSDGGSKTFSDLLPGTYNFTETVPGGWTLTSVNCTGGTCTNITNGVSINLASGENVTCTFTDTKL
ncbi:unnamed protein product, partial [marine sediment metagenome]